jgi:hypothetical protein
VELITISAVSSVAVPFLVSKAPRAGAVLLAPIRGIKAISAFLVSDSQERSASAKRRGFLPDVFSLGCYSSSFSMLPAGDRILIALRQPRQRARRQVWIALGANRLQAQRGRC